MDLHVSWSNLYFIFVAWGGWYRVCKMLDGGVNAMGVILVFAALRICFGDSKASQKDLFSIS